MPAAQSAQARAQVDGPSRKAAGSGWLVVPRAILFLPRMAVRYLLLKPIDLGVKLFQRWGDSPGMRLALNTAVRTGFRARYGLAYTSGSFLGMGNEFTISASYRNKEFQTYELEWIASLGEHNEFKLHGTFDRDGDSQFHGIGYVDKNRTRYRLEEIHAGFELDTEWAEQFQTELLGGWTRFQAQDASDLASGEITLSDRFDPTAVIGFNEAQNFAFGSFKNVLDLRGPVAGDGVEMMFRSHVDAYYALEGQDYSTLLYGGELEFAVPFFREGRSFAIRGLLEAAEELGGSEIPFYLLPTIGRGDALRGYPTGRMRDKLMTVASAEYRWNISQQSDALLFFDTGRVFSDYADFDFEGWKWGAGAGLRFKGKERPLGSLQIAYSPEMVELVLVTGAELF